MLISFPVPHVNHYTIDYDTVTQTASIPLVPEERTEAVHILSVFCAELIDSGTIDVSDIEMVLDTICLALKNVYGSENIEKEVYSPG